MKKIVAFTIILLFLFGCIDNGHVQSKNTMANIIAPISMGSLHPQYKLIANNYTKTDTGVSFKSNIDYPQVDENIELLGSPSVVKGVSGSGKNDTLTSYQVDDIVLTEKTEPAESNIPIEAMDGNGIKQTIKITNYGDDKNVSFKINYKIYANTFYYSDEKIVLSPGQVKEIKTDNIEYGEINIRKLQKGQFKAKTYDGGIVTYDPMGLTQNIDKIIIKNDGKKSIVSIFVTVPLKKGTEVTYDPVLTVSPPDKTIHKIKEFTVPGNEYFIKTCQDSENGNSYVALFTLNSGQQGTPTNNIIVIVNPEKNKENKTVVIKPLSKLRFQTLGFDDECNLYIATIFPTSIIRIEKERLLNENNIMIDGRESVISGDGEHYIGAIDNRQIEGQSYLGVGMYSLKGYANVYVLYNLNKMTKQKISLEDYDLLFYTDNVKPGTAQFIPHVAQINDALYFVVKDKNVVYHADLNNIKNTIKNNKEFKLPQLFSINKPLEIENYNGWVYVSSVEGVYKFDSNAKGLYKISNVSYGHLSSSKDEIIISSYDNNEIEWINNNEKLTLEKPLPQTGVIDDYKNGFIHSYSENGTVHLSIYGLTGPEELNCNPPLNGTYYIQNKTVVCYNRTIQNIDVHDSYFECINCNISRLTGVNSNIVSHDSMFGTVTADKLSLSGTFKPINNVILNGTFNVTYTYYIKHSDGSPVQNGWFEVKDYENGTITEGIINPSNGRLSFTVSYSQDHPEYLNWRLVAHASEGGMDGGIGSGSGGSVVLGEIETECCNLTNMNGCDNVIKVVSDSGENDYYVNGDTLLCRDIYNLQDPSNNGAIIINSSNLIFDCNDSNIYGYHNGKGIKIGNCVNKFHNVTIKNCDISYYKLGVWSIMDWSLQSESFNVLILNNTIHNNNYGIDVETGGYITFENNRIYANYIGVYSFDEGDCGAEDYDSWHNHIFINNTIGGNTIGLSDNAVYGEYLNNNICYNALHDVELLNTHSPEEYTFDNNSCEKAYSVEDAGSTDGEEELTGFCEYGCSCPSLNVTFKVCNSTGCYPFENYPTETTSLYNWSPSSSNSQLIGTDDVYILPNITYNNISIIYSINNTLANSLTFIPTCYILQPTCHQCSGIYSNCSGINYRNCFFDPIPDSKDALNGVCPIYNYSFSGAPITVAPSTYTSNTGNIIIPMSNITPCTYIECYMRPNVQTCISQNCNGCNLSKAVGFYYNNTPPHINDMDMELLNHWTCQATVDDLESDILSYSGRFYYNGNEYSNIIAGQSGSVERDEFNNLRINCAGSEQCNSSYELSPGDNITCCINLTDQTECCPKWVYNCTTYIQEGAYVHVEDYNTPSHWNDTTTYFCNYSLSTEYEPYMNVTYGWAVRKPTGELTIISSKTVDYENGDDIESDTGNNMFYFSPSMEGIDVCKCDEIICFVNVTNQTDGSEIVFVPSYGEYFGYEPDDVVTQDDGMLSIINYPPELDITLTREEIGEGWAYYNCSAEYSDADNESSCEDPLSVNYEWIITGSATTGDGCGNEDDFCNATITGGTGFNIICNVTVCDSERNGDCQNCVEESSEDEVIRSATCDSHITVGYNPPTAILGIPDPDDQTSCPPILPDETPNPGCAYEDSNFTCYAHNSAITYTGIGNYWVCFDIVDEAENVVYSDCDFDNSDGYWNITYNDCLEDENCGNCDNLSCVAHIYDMFGELSDCESPDIMVHNFKPEINKPMVLVITESMMNTDLGLLGEYIDEYNLNTLEYYDKYVCMPNDLWLDNDRTPDYNNDNWNTVKYYWEWSPVDTGYVQVSCNGDEVSECTVNGEYSGLCIKDSEGNPLCFDDEIKNYLCNLACERQNSDACTENVISCWGPDENNQSHWLPLNPMVYNLSYYDAYSFIPYYNATGFRSDSKGVCGWAVMGGLCSEQQDQLMNCTDEGYIGTNEWVKGIIENETARLQQCNENIPLCYGMLENCSYNYSWMPGEPLPDAGYRCDDIECDGAPINPEGAIGIISLDLVPECVCTETCGCGEKSWAEHGCGETEYSEFNKSYFYMITTWYLKHGWWASDVSNLYQNEVLPCNSNIYFGTKYNPHLPAIPMTNYYLTDVRGLFYLNQKPNGIPLRCCIQMSDDTCEPGYTNWTCSDPTCGMFLGCGRIDTSGLPQDDPDCLTNSTHQCYIYLYESCDNEIKWKTPVDQCGKPENKTYCSYNTTLGTAFNVTRTIDLVTGEIVEEVNDEVDYCYPCLQYWPIEGDPDFDENDFSDNLYAYYYEPWWLRDVLWNASYSPQPEDSTETYPDPHKVNLREDAVVYENVTLNDTSRIVYPCDPDDETGCETSLHEWWAGPWGAYQNDTFECLPTNEKIELLSNVAKMSDDELMDYFDIDQDGTEGSKIVGRFYASDFTYCNQWDWQFYKDYMNNTLYVNQSDHDQIDELYMMLWPDVERNATYYGYYAYTYPWGGRLGMPGYLSTGIFTHPNGIGFTELETGPRAPWVWNYNSSLDNYLKLNCSEIDPSYGSLYKQCKKHARISCNIEFGVVYNESTQWVDCECPADDVSACYDNFIEPDRPDGLEPPRWYFEWRFDKNNCECVPGWYCNVTFVEEEGPPENECEHPKVPSGETWIDYHECKMHDECVCNESYVEEQENNARAECNGWMDGGSTCNDGEVPYCSWSINEDTCNAEVIKGCTGCGSSTCPDGQSPICPYPICCPCSADTDHAGECVRPCNDHVPSPPPDEDEEGEEGGSGSQGTGGGYLKGKSSNIIPKTVTEYTLLAGNDQFTLPKSILFQSEDESEMEYDYPWNEIQNESDNWFVDDIYYEMFVNFSENKGEMVRHITDGTIELDCSDLGDHVYDGYIFRHDNYCDDEGRYLLWNLSNCNLTTDEELKYKITTFGKNETENEGCGFCRGLLVNNSAPVIEAACRDMELVSGNTYRLNASANWSDADTHPADSAKVMHYRFCLEVNDTDGDGTPDDCANNQNLTDWIDVENEDVANVVVPNLTNYDITLPSEVLPEDVWVCAYGNDTGWQSKESNHICGKESCEHPSPPTYPCNTTVIVKECYNTSENIIPIISQETNGLEECNVTCGLTGISCLHANYTLLNASGEEVESGYYYGMGIPLHFSGLPIGEYTLIVNSTYNSSACNEDAGEHFGYVCAPNITHFEVAESCGVIPITNCTVIDKPGNYVLVNDLTPDKTDLISRHWHEGTTTNNIDCCIILENDSINFDLRGHKITAQNYGSLKTGAICSLGYDNLNIQNGIVDVKTGWSEDWDHSIFLLSVKNVTIKNIRQEKEGWKGGIWLSKYSVYTPPGAPPYSGRLPRESSNILIDNLTTYHTSYIGIIGNGVDNLTIKNSKFILSQPYSIWLQQYPSTIRNNNITIINNSFESINNKLFTSHVYFEGNNGKIINNTFNHGGGAVDTVNSSNVDIVNNTIKQTYGTGIRIGLNSKYINILNNYLHNVANLTISTPSGSRTIEGKGIELYDGSSVIVNKNYIANVDSKGLDIINKNSLNNHNNIIVFNNIGSDAPSSGSASNWYLNNNFICYNNINDIQFTTPNIICNNNNADKHNPMATSACINDMPCPNCSITPPTLDCIENDEHVSLTFVVNDSNPFFSDIRSYEGYTNVTCGSAVPDDYQLSVTNDSVHTYVTINFTANGHCVVNVSNRVCNSTVSFNTQEDCNNPEPCNMELSIIAPYLEGGSGSNICSNSTHIRFVVNITDVNNCSCSGRSCNISDATLLINETPYLLTPFDSELIGQNITNSPLPIGTYNINASIDCDYGCSVEGMFNIVNCEGECRHSCSSCNESDSIEDNDCCSGEGECVNGECCIKHNNPCSPGDCCCDPGDVCSHGICQPPKEEPEKTEGGGNISKINKGNIKYMESPGPLTAVECSMSVCNRTADCCFGYCKDNVCTFPPKPEYMFGYFAKPGCAGLNISPTGILGFVICDMMWLWIILMSGLAGWYSRMHKFKPMPAVMFIIPIMIGFFTYPYLGIVTAGFEMFAFSRYYAKMVNKNK